MFQPEISSYLKCFSLIFQLYTQQIDPTTKETISDEIEQLYVEPYYITVSSRPYDEKLDGKRTSSRQLIFSPEHFTEDDDIEEELISVEATDKPVNSIHPKQRIHNGSKRTPQLLERTVKKVIPSSIDKPKFNLERQIVFPQDVPNLYINVRLKSGEIVKISKPVFAKLRDLSRQTINNEPSTSSTETAANGIEIQSVSKPSIIHVPFTDRLSDALTKLRTDQENDLSVDKSQIPVHSVKKDGDSGIKNGKIVKTVKLRAALDKSSVAWASTTRLKPKTSLLEQLKTLTNTAACQSSSPKKIPSVNSHLPKLRKPPVVIRLTAKFPKNCREMTTLSNALKKIAGDETVTNGGGSESPTCNGKI